MRSASASLAARSRVCGKNRIVCGSALSAANGARSDSSQRHMSSRSVRMASNLAGLGYRVLLGSAGRRRSRMKPPASPVKRVICPAAAR